MILNNSVMVTQVKTSMHTHLPDILSLVSTLVFLCIFSFVAIHVLSLAVSCHYVFQSACLLVLHPLLCSRTVFEF